MSDVEVVRRSNFTLHLPSPNHSFNSNSMDVYDPTLTQSQSKPDSEAESKEARTAQADDSKAQQSSSQSSSSVQPVELESPTLEQEVQQLVGGITSWWSGVTKKVSTT